MSYRKSSCAPASVLVVLALMLTACQQGSPQAAAPTADNTPQGVHTDGNHTVEPQPSDSGAGQEQAVVTQPKTAQSLDNGTTVAANASASPKPESSANAKQEQAEANPYSAQNPTLMGLSLQMSKDKVTAAYGKPSDQFKMDDETEPLTVFDYDDFSVGFDNGNRLQFVDVSGSDVNPGLNGLRIGQKSSQAIEALGKPDTQTNYVLTYKSKTTVLKLDIDPKTTVIRSIKLFARADS
ncbi:DUF4309 domain-containing protein [Paenibacillus contaminans]|uniref:DUF4309 domain-containing protein n=1 Tax=Paenibacillus contaminans TaxID=450362 RepID=A0A329MNZ4_9BACL|nr:DUF4309 domain-containing protein [Paenibacillus contaminans]RAV21681.1 DUF4309 domain-containing protein [Paenibacillus contaminans]